MGDQRRHRRHRRGDGQVPKSEGHQGGITAFILDHDTEGVTVEHRNAFMGLRGIENSVTLLEDVFIPKENVIGKEGEGLKIALTTLNTGRLALPAICAAAPRVAKIAREWAAERVQWGQPVGKHDAVAQKIAFIAGTAFGLEAMLDVVSPLGRRQAERHPHRGRAAKLYASELGWKVVDELVQVRGGRGYETAESLKARGEKPVPVEQVFRDMRINRIFEGSTEIMQLLIAREAVDQHLEVAGEILDPDIELKEKAKRPSRPASSTASGCRSWRSGRVRSPARSRSSATWPSTCASPSAARASWPARRSTAMSRWQAGLEKKQSFLGRIVDIGAELFAIASAVRLRQDHGRGAPGAAGVGPGAGRAVLPPGPPPRRPALRRPVRQRRRRELRRREEGPRRRYTWIEEGILDPSGGGPMIADENEELAPAGA